MQKVRCWALPLLLWEELGCQHQHCPLSDGTNSTSLFLLCPTAFNFPLFSSTVSLLFLLSFTTSFPDPVILTLQHYSLSLCYSRSAVQPVYGSSHLGCPAVVVLRSTVGLWTVGAKGSTSQPEGDSSSSDPCWERCPCCAQEAAARYCWVGAVCQGCHWWPETCQQRGGLILAS